MKCVVCKSSDIQMKTVEEEIGSDIILIPIDVLVCLNCGERYYDRKTLKKIEELKSKATSRDLKIEEVGKVFKALVA
ncbi:MAG: YgiT-type zinc finger protein [Deltaproteobacteria bacterium]|nr:YgiT-type zinc finger protein [Deltaproteobacteria bacterium]